MPPILTCCFVGQACALVEQFFAGGSRDALLQFLDGTQDRVHHPAPSTSLVAETVARGRAQRHHSTHQRDCAGLNTEWRQVVEVMDSGENGERALDALVLQVAFFFYAQMRTWCEEASVSHASLRTCPPPQPAAVLHQPLTVLGA